ncbi:MAG: hypothetical protein WED11_06635 [Natronospirillum sp.]
MKLEYYGIHEMCLRHAQRLQWALGQVRPLLPLSGETLQEMDDMQLAIHDQLITRFSKLQDAMGAKLLPFILELTKEQGEMPTFIDKLNRLEKIAPLNP